MIVDTIHHPTKVTNHCQNMSHCTQNWQMIVTTMHHYSIETHHTHSIVTHYALIQ